MLEYITVFGRTIPMYGLMAVTGFLIGLIVAYLRCKSFGIDKAHCAYIMAMGGIGAAIGAKVLYIITILPDFISDFHYLFTDTSLFISTYISGGMVFYGGFIGAVVAVAIYAKVMDISLYDYFPVIIPSFALIHAFGRVGCFFAGCCYGIEVDKSIGVMLNNSSVAPHGVYLLPVQLIEAFFEIVIFVILVILSKRVTRKGNLLAYYCLMYAPLRFILEFFRGDVIRGFWGGLSTSQWISIAVLIAAIVYLAFGKFRKVKEA